MAFACTGSGGEPPGPHATGGRAGAAGDAGGSAGTGGGAGGNSGAGGSGGAGGKSGSSGAGGGGGGAPARAQATLVSPEASGFVSPLGDLTLTIDVTLAGQLEFAIRDETSQPLFVDTRVVEVGRATLTVPALKLPRFEDHEVVLELNGEPYPRTVGPSWFIAGQSNSANWECTACAPADFPVARGDRLWFLADASLSPTNDEPASPLAALGAVTWERYSTLPGGVVPIAHGLARAFWPSVLDRLAATNRWEHRAVSTGVGGTSITAWSSGDYLYRRFGYLSSLNTVDAVLWVQGETDAINGMTTGTYASHMLTMKHAVEANYMTHLATLPPWVLFVTTGAGCGASAPNQQKIRAAIEGLVADYPGEFLRGPDFDALPHGCHFDSASEFAEGVGSIVTTLEALFPRLLR